MKFTLKSKAFAAAMQVVGKVVERRNTYPILSNVWLHAADRRLNLRATDLDIEITLSIEAAVDTPGTTTLPASMLSDILRKLPDAEVKFEHDDKAGRMKISTGRSKYELATLSADSFPDLKGADFRTKFDISGKELAIALATCAFAISNEETRYYLNGVYWHPIQLQGQEYVNFVATDGHRMAQCRRKIEGTQGMPPIIVPKKTVGEIIKMAEAAGEKMLTVEVADTKIRVSNNDRLVLLSKLIEGTFPDYDRVTPKGNNIIAIVDVAQFAKCVDRVSTIASERGGKAVKLSFEKQVLTLEVSNPDHGVATDELPVEMDADATNTTGFNARYLNDILDHIGKGKAQVAMLDAGSPTLITPVDSDDIKFVLMPMRV